MLVNCFIKRYLTFLLVLFMIDLKKLIDGLLISNRGGRKILLKLIEGGASIRNIRVQSCTKVMILLRKASVFTKNALLSHAPLPPYTQC